MYVYKSVLELNTEQKQKQQRTNFFKVGLELRELLASVDRLIPYFPSSTHRQVNNDLSTFERNIYVFRGHLKNELSVCKLEISDF